MVFNLSELFWLVVENLKSKQTVLLSIKIILKMESTKIDSELLTKLVEEAQIEKLTNPKVLTKA